MSVHIEREEPSADVAAETQLGLTSSQSRPGSGGRLGLTPKVIWCAQHVCAHISIELSAQSAQVTPPPV